MAPQISPLFKSSPDWERVSNDPARPDLELKPAASVAEPLDVPAQRARLAAHEAEWSSRNPPSSYGYESNEESIPTRDGQQISAKVYWPQGSRDSDQTFPLLFVSHAGGWIQGSPITEEIFMIKTILENYRLVVVSVCFRLAPEHAFPTQVNDCEDGLLWAVSNASRLQIDDSKLFLAGSSAGGNLTACLAQIVRDKRSVAISGVLLNVSNFCHPSYFPKDKYQYTSYDECVGTLLSSGEMRTIWDLYLTESGMGSMPLASPLLGDLKGLPPHFIFVAGQDPVRDEGIAYAKALKDAGVKGDLKVYPGVPHEFAEFEELETTARFRKDLIEAVGRMLKA